MAAGDVESLASDALTTEAELAKIEQFRERHAEDLRPRKEAGTLWPAVFGDYIFTRHLRGQGGDVDKMDEGWSNYMDAFAKLDGDELMAKCTAVYESIEKEGRLVKNEDIPGYEDVKEYVRLIHNADPTPAGDCVIYQPLCDVKTRQIMEKGLYDKYRYFAKCQTFLRWIELDALSHKQGRLVKFVRIFDLFKSSMTSQHKDFRAEEDKFGAMIGAMQPLNLGNRFMINVPWYMAKMASSFIGNKQLMHVCDGNGTEDAELLALVPAAKLLQYQSTRIGPEDDDAIAEDGSTYIAPGAALEKTLEVKAGQKVSWTFSIVEGGMLLSSPEVEFKVEAMWFPKESVTISQPMDLKVTLIEPKVYTASDGTVNGECTAEDAGVVMLVWSNEGNWLRSKNVHVKVDSS